MSDAAVAALAGGLTLGFFGSLHCLGMCGGIVAALGQVGAREGRGAPLHALWYHVGRTGSYAVAGGLAGLAGDVFAGALGAGPALRVLTGALLLAAGTYVAGWWRGLEKLERWAAPLWRRISPATRRLLPANTALRRLLLGALWGWLPCGLVYSALLLAAASGDPRVGALALCAFGLGTWPSLLGAGVLGRLASRGAHPLAMRRSAGLALCLFGLWTAAGPLAMRMLHDPAAHGGVGTAHSGESEHRAGRESRVDPARGSELATGSAP